MASVTDADGDIKISYNVSDGNGGTLSTEFTLTVNPINDNPVANDDSFHIQNAANA